MDREIKRKKERELKEIQRKKGKEETEGKERRKEVKKKYKERKGKNRQKERKRKIKKKFSYLLIKICFSLSFSEFSNNSFQSPYEFSVSL